MRCLVTFLLFVLTAHAATDFRVGNWSGQTIYFRLDTGDALNPQSIVASIGQGETFELRGQEVTTCLIRPYFTTNWTEYSFVPAHAYANAIEIKVMQDYTVLMEQGRTEVGYFLFGFTVACGFGLSALALRIFNLLGKPSPDL